MKIISETENKMKIKLSLRTVIGRISIVLAVVIIAIIVLGFTVMGTVINGPSTEIRDLFVISCMETSFAKIFPPMYISNEEINQIKSANTVIPINEVTDTITKFKEPIEEVKDLEIVDVVGSTYKGKMLIVKDPSRIRLVTPPVFGADIEGSKLLDMINSNDAIAGINGGGFADENGVGKGGLPIGIVVKDGVIMHGNGGSSNVIGFDVNNVLHVGYMSSKEVEERKIRDAVSFGPALIVNGKSTQTKGNSGGLNPRTAMGQREDGAVLMLVIDGRQPHSLGASFKDIVDVMIDFGAVNASNLDGGSSTMMYYKGELLNKCASLYGPRQLPTAFIEEK